MKKVIVVSKTHLDLGFTDYAENIRQNLAIEYVDKTLSTLIANEAAKGNYSVRIAKPECGELKTVRVYLKSNGYKVISFGKTWRIAW